MRSDPLMQAFADTVARAPAAPLVAASRTLRRSALSIDRAASALAEEIRAAGFAAGDLVGLAAAPGPAFLEGYVALRRCSVVPVLCDSAQPTHDRLEALDRLGVTGFLWEETGWPRGVESWRLDRRLPAAVLAGDPSWGAIKLTSGSTGEPKGIAVDTLALIADDLQLASTMGLEAGDRFLATVPFSHSYGFSSLVLPALIRGSMLIVPRDRSPFAPLLAAGELGATVFPTVPAWLAAHLRAASPPDWPPSLRLVISAGEPLPVAVARAHRQRTGRPVHVFYGASECGGIAYDRTGDAGERGTVGTAVDGVELELDEREGRLRVRSPAVAERYLPDAAGELGAGAFLTGDLVTLDGGEVRLLGRADDWVIVRGRNVNPREVELAVLQLPGVEEATVFGVDGPDGPRSVLSLVVAVPGGGVDPEAVVGFLRQRLSAYKVPRSVSVVRDLPRTGHGKLDRAALAGVGERRTGAT